MSDLTRKIMPTVSEREEAGQAARKSLGRGALADWVPAERRPDPVALLAEQEQSRVQELLPVRHERMSVSPFTFYRGTAVVMANDLGVLPTSGLNVQLCGDAHMSNFGMFAAPDRSVIFDVNDFDETNPGPFEWDVIRLAVSALLAANENGVSAKDANTAVAACVLGYQRGMQEYARMTNLDIWYNRIDVSELTKMAKDAGDKAGAKGLQKAVKKARTRDAWSAASKLTEVGPDGRRTFVNQPPLVAPIPMEGELAHRALTMFDQYLETMSEAPRRLIDQYSIVDLGHKVVGVGSVGLLSLVGLMQGRDETDLLILQFKQAQTSVLEPFSGASEYTQHGERVVVGQRLMQAASDAFLGWMTGPLGRAYYVRQLRDMKWSPDLATFDGAGLVKYAALCGGTLARAHARTGDAVAINSYLGTSSRFADTMVAFAQRYAKVVDSDYAEFLAAVKDGRLGKAEQDPAQLDDAAGPVLNAFKRPVSE